LDVLDRAFFRGHEGEEVRQRVARDLVEPLAGDLEPFDLGQLAAVVAPRRRRR